MCARWLRADAGRTVSITKIVSLSPRVENLRVKKVIKVSYLNQESRQCFAYFGIPMHVNVLHICIFHVFVDYGYIYIYIYIYAVILSCLSLLCVYVFGQPHRHTKHYIYIYRKRERERERERV